MSYWQPSMCVVKFLDDAPFGAKIQLPFGSPVPVSPRVVNSNQIAWVKTLRVATSVIPPTSTLCCLPKVLTHQARRPFQPLGGFSSKLWHAACIIPDLRQAKVNRPQGHPPCKYKKGWEASSGMFCGVVTVRDISHPVRPVLLVFSYLLCEHGIQRTVPHFTCSIGLWSITASLQPFDIKYLENF